MARLLACCLAVYFARRISGMLALYRFWLGTYVYISEGDCSMLQDFAAGVKVTCRRSVSAAFCFCCVALCRPLGALFNAAERSRTVPTFPPTSSAHNRSCSVHHIAHLPCLYLSHLSHLAPCLYPVISPPPAPAAAYYRYLSRALSYLHLAAISCRARLGMLTCS